MYKKCFECKLAEDEWAKFDWKMPGSWGCGEETCHPESGRSELYIFLKDKDEQIRRIIEWRIKLGVRLS